MGDGTGNSDKLKRILAIPVEICCPATDGGLWVLAKPDIEFGGYGGDWGLLGCLSADAICRLDISDSACRIRNFADQSEGSLWEGRVVDVEIHILGEKITGDMLAFADEDRPITTVFRSFLNRAKGIPGFDQYLVSEVESPRVFISYSHDDCGEVEALINELRSSGVSVWIDREEILVGQSLIEKIERAVEKTDLFIAILSPASVNSRWVRKELDMAMRLEIETGRVRVLPVILKRCELPGFIKGKLYVDLDTGRSREEEISKLINSIYVLSGKK